MKALKIKPEIVTFSPNLHAVDPLANYWIRQVSLRLRREVCWAWHERGVRPGSNPASLPPFIDKASESLGLSRHWEEKKKFFKEDPTAGYLTEQIEADLPQENFCPHGSLGWVMDRLNLNDTASFVLALGLAVTFDRAVGSVISACLNDPAKTYPNLALVQLLWDEPEEVLKLADPYHPLFRYGLLQQMDHLSHQSSGIAWENPLVAPGLVGNKLLFPNGSLPQCLTYVTVENKENGLLTENAHLPAARLNLKRDTLCVVPIRGPRGSAHIETVAELAELARRQVVEFKGTPDLLRNSRYLNSLATLCWLNGADLYLGRDLISILLKDKQCADTHFSFLHSIPINIFIGISGREQLSYIPHYLMLPMVDVPTFSYTQRLTHWKKRLGGKALGLEGVISECSRRFRYEKETINEICEGLKGLSGPISENDFNDACRAEMDLNMGELAQRVTPRFQDEKLILPYKQDILFQEIVKAMRSLTEVHYGWGTAGTWSESGISVLFGGPPGTGKTMAAEILAGKLNLPMFRIDLSQVVNKYIGETEKNLKKLFDTADISDLILFFDEADALFGKRTEVKDAHDRYANLEISYLLERMERFKGLAILATNRKKDLDAAFLRRLRYIVDFPLPGVEQRKEIWRQIIPKTVDCSNIDLNFLAKQFQLAGGHIRSIIFNACLQSANDPNFRSNDFKGRLTMEQIIISVKREFDKINRTVSLEYFGPYAEIVKRMEHGNGEH